MSATVVLAEDSKTVRKMVEIALGRQPFSLEVATDGEAALARVREASPAVLLVDTHLPGVDGYEVARRVKSTQPEVKVILLAGHHQVLDADRASRSGADGHLTKPFKTQELLDAVYAGALGRPAPDAELFREAASSIPLARKPAPAPAPAPGPAAAPRPAPVAPAPPAPPASVVASSNPFAGVQSPFEASEPTRPFFKGPEALPPSAPAPAVAAPVVSAPVVSAISAATVSTLTQAVAPSVPVTDPAAIKAALEALSKETIERMLWEIIPPLAEAILKEEIAKVVRERLNAG
jgi:CheY-like chemotaxis protein